MIKKRQMRVISVIFGVSLCCFFLLIALKSSGVSAIKKKIATCFSHEARRVLKNNSSRKDTPFSTALYGILKKLGTTSADSAHFACRKFVDSSSKDTLISLAARLPKGHPFEWLVWNISQAIVGTSYSVSDCCIDEKKQRCTFSFASADKKAPRVQLVISRSERFQAGVSKMAIIGEVGSDSSYQTIVSYLAIPERLSIALLPGKKQSTLLAQLAFHYSKEIIIRLPLEPASKIPSSFTTPVVMVHYTRDNIRSIVSQAALSLPHFSGFTNVWGSRALEDSRITNLVLSEIKNEHGFFLETKATKNSLASMVAETMGVPYEEVTGALADKTKQTDLEKQLKAFCVSAQLTGFVIVTAPITPLFIAAVKATLPIVRQNGIALVYVSELVNKPTEP